jgi:hypothetical protein
VKQPTKPQDTKRQSDVRGGITLAITAFAISIFLYFQPEYFGALTTVVAIALIALGFAGLGIELDKITSEELDSLVNREKGPGIFDNLGIGIAFLIVWATLYRYFPVTWVNVLTSAILLFGAYAITLGLVNALLSQGNSDKPWSLAIKIATAISGIIGLTASLIQILQFFKMIP